MARLEHNSRPAWAREPGQGKIIDQIVRGVAAHARERGIQCPVVPLIAPCSVGQAICLEATGKPLPPPPPSVNRYPYIGIEPWDVPKATRLLHRHAGLGGMAVANLLLAPPKAADSWMVMIDGEALLVTAYKKDRFAFQSAVCYGGLEFLSCLGVGGERDEEADDMLALALAHLASKRRLPGGDGFTIVGMPVDETLLTRIIQEFYLSKPAVVSAALARLKDACPEGHRWLRSLLTRNNASPSC